MRNSFTKEKAQDHVLFSEQIRTVDYKIYPDKKQNHLGKHKAMHRASGKPRCNIVDYRVPGISLSTVQQQDEQRQHTVAKLIEKFLKIRVRRRRSTGSVKHRKNCCKIWTRQRSSNSVRILRNCNAPIATPSRIRSLAT